MRAWDPRREQGSRVQRRIAAAGPPPPRTAHEPGMERYGVWFAKIRKGQVLDVSASFAELVASARGGWEPGVEVMAAHRAPDKRPVLLGGAPFGPRCGATRWVPEVPGGPVAELVAAVRTLRALDAAPEPGLQKDRMVGSGTVQSQEAWLSGQAEPGVDGFRVECALPARHEGACEVQARMGALVWRWDQRAGVIVN